MNNKANIHFSSMGTQAILLTWKEEVSERLLNLILNAKTEIQKINGEKILDIITTYNALLIKYKFPLKVFNEEIKTLKKIFSSVEDRVEISKTLFHLPVCYDERFGLDFPEIIAAKKLDKETIIHLHTQPTYTVYFTGFLPGFPYLGGLSKKLYMDRKENPRKRIPKGSVGIGGEQTGIYPSSSPGGWQLIGNCPVILFDPQKESPCLFNPGDQIKFYQVSLKEYEEIQAEIDNGAFKLKQKVCK